jgi:hypothetical protein
VNRSLNVEGFTENDDRSIIPIRNPSLCENKDYFEHKMYQPRFISHVLGADYRKATLLHDWDLNPSVFNGLPKMTFIAAPKHTTQR